MPQRVGTAPHRARSAGGRVGLGSILQRKLDLWTGTPVWDAYPLPRVPKQRPARDITCDLLIVGMGISGAMIADLATAAGRNVVMVDRRGPVKGSTAATTALVQFEIDRPLSALSRMIGRDAAMRAWRRSRLAVSNLGRPYRGTGHRLHADASPVALSGG